MIDKLDKFCIGVEAGLAVLGFVFFQLSLIGGAIVFGTMSATILGSHILGVHWGRSIVKHNERPCDNCGRPQNGKTFYMGENYTHICQKCHIELYDWVVTQTGQTLYKCLFCKRFLNRAHYPLCETSPKVCPDCRRKHEGKEFEHKHGVYRIEKGNLWEKTCR